MVRLHYIIYVDMEKHSEKIIEDEDKANERYLDFVSKTFENMLKSKHIIYTNLLKIRFKDLLSFTFINKDNHIIEHKYVLERVDD